MNKISYRGYFICHNYMNGFRWIEKDGFKIAQGFETALHGRLIIDELLGKNTLSSSILSAGPL